MSTSQNTQTHNVLVLGGSFAGLSTAHYFLKHVLPSLKNSSSYKLTLVSPSTHFFWRPASVRGVASSTLMPTEKMFFDIPTGFEQYPKEQFEFVQGEATGFDAGTRTATITLTPSGASEQSQPLTVTINYTALVLATGIRTVSPLQGLHGSHSTSVSALSAFHEALPKAKHIVIAGGGPAGVETAGELGEELNGAAGWFSSRPAHIKTKITVLSGSDKLLPALRPALAQQAEKLLNRVGVDVLHGKEKRVVSTSPANAGENLETITSPTTLTLEDGSTLECDLYLPATGVIPNTSFLPAQIKTETGYVKTNRETLRVDAAGPRVYAIGDVADYSSGGIMDLYGAVPVVMTNLKRDMLFFSKHPNSSSEDLANEKATAVPGGKDRIYKVNDKETQLVPVGRNKGVGAVFGWKLPSFMVWLIKGRTFFTQDGPAIAGGQKWSKESKWQFEA